MNMKTIVSAAMVLLLGSAVARACSQEAVTLRMTKSGDEIWLVLDNGTDQSFIASSAYSLAGKSSGNLIPIVIDKLGIPAPSCAFISASDIFWNPKPLPSQESLEIWRSSVGTIARLHCLEAGDYTLVIAYSDPAGRLRFSNQVEISVE